ncbi:MAG: alpha/beta fold hydrolase [Geminicoccaceae bacterium]
MKREIRLPAFRHSFTGWSDTALFAGWHVQRHVEENRHRLVDPDGGVVAEGRADVMLERWRNECGDGGDAGDRVLLLHGLSRTGRIYHRLGRVLHDCGFTVLAPSYPSLRQSLDDHARDMRCLLDCQPGHARLSLVGHSLGGLLVHRLVDGPGEWKGRLALTAAVLITVPHKGSRLGAMLARHQAAARLAGPSLADCLPGRQRLASFGDLPTLNILGLTGYRTGFNPVLGSDNDFILTEDEMRLDDPVREARIPSPHGVIHGSPRTAMLVRDFLCEAHGLPHGRTIEGKGDIKR